MASSTLNDSATQERISQSNTDGLRQYKTMLQDILKKRPSGTRRRLAVALGKNPSFISQIANPVYSVPIPASHLQIVFEICHFSQQARREFLAAYDRAHPGRLAQNADRLKRRAITIHIPQLDDDRRNQQIESMVREFARQLTELVGDE